MENDKGRDRTTSQISQCIVILVLITEVKGLGGIGLANRLPVEALTGATPVGGEIDNSGFLDMNGKIVRMPECFKLFLRAEGDHPGARICLGVHRNVFYPEYWRSFLRKLREAPRRRKRGVPP